MESDQFIFSNQYDWSNRQMFAKGGFGYVYKVKHIENGQYVAVKQMPMYLFDADYKIKALNLQIESIKQIHSPHVVELITYNIGKQYTYIILQLCDNSLKGLLNTKIMLDQKQAINMICDMVHGYQSLLKCNYIHRDIKPANILIKNNLIKLTDFGFATKIKTQLDKLHQICGTPLYMAPQLIYGKQYTSKCDVWSLGLVFYEMLFGCSPWVTKYYETYQKDVVSRVVSFPYDYKIGQNTKDFISKCLELEEDDRISWKQIFQHPLIKTKSPGKYILYPAVPLKTQKILAKVQLSSTFQLINAKKLFQKYQTIKKVNQKGFYQFLVILDPQITTYQSKQIFQAADFSHDGLINMQQFKKIYLQIDYRPSNEIATKRIQQIAHIAKTKKITSQQLFKQIDKDKSSDIDYKQFQISIKKIVPYIQTRQIQLMWKKFDKDKSGTISLIQFISQIMYGMIPLEKIDFKNYQRAKRNLNCLYCYLKDNNINIQKLLQNKTKYPKIMTINQFGIFITSINYVITRDQIVEMFRLIDLNDSNQIQIVELEKLINQKY